MYVDCKGSTSLPNRFIHTVGRCLHPNMYSEYGTTTPKWVFAVAVGLPSGYYILSLLAIAVFAIVIGFRKCCRSCCRTGCCTLCLISCRHLTSAIRCFQKWHYYCETTMDMLLRLKSETANYAELQMVLSKHDTFSELMLGINMHLAEYCFKYFPSGSMAEGYGAWWWKTDSILASDVDLMLIPSGTGLKAGKRCPDYMHLFHTDTEGVSGNYIKLQLNQDHPASDRWKSMCNAETVDEQGRTEFYLSNARIRIALGNALREDFYDRTLKIHEFKDRSIQIELHGPALNVKVLKDVQPTGLFLNLMGCCGSPQNPTNCWPLIYCCACLIFPPVLIIPTYECIVGKSMFTGRPINRARTKPQPSVVLVPERQKDKEVVFDADFVFAVPTEWPEDTREKWEEDHSDSPWLSQETNVINEVTNQQCYVVPKPPASANTITGIDSKETQAGWDKDGAFYKVGESSEGSSGNDWRLSFSKQEKYLADRISNKWPSLHLAFLGVKSAVKKVAKDLDVQLPSYTVKTAFLLFMDTLDVETLREMSTVVQAEDQSYMIQNLLVHEVITDPNILVDRPPRQPQPAEKAFEAFLLFFIKRLRKQENNRPPWEHATQSRENPQEPTGVLHYFTQKTELTKDMNERDREKIVDALCEIANDPSMKLGKKTTTVEKGCCPGSWYPTIKYTKIPGEPKKATVKEYWMKNESPFDQPHVVPNEGLI